MADDDALIPFNGPRRPTGAQQWEEAIRAQQQREAMKPSMGEQVGNVINWNIDRAVHGNPLAQISQMYQDIATGNLDPLSPQAAGRGLRTTLSMVLEGLPYAQRGSTGVTGGRPSVPRGEGERAISEALDRMQARGRGNEWVQVPEGGQGIYMRMRPDGIDVANVSFETTGTGAFTRYLDHIEAQAAQRGLGDVTVENIFNERLIPFLEKRGFTLRGGDPPSMVKRIIPATGEGFIDIDKYYGPKT